MAETATVTHRIKAPEPASGLRELGAGLVLFGPVLAYLALGVSGTSLHFPDPALNRLAHGIVLLIPFVWSSALLAFPVRLREDREAVIVDSGPFHAFDRNWHQGALILPGLLLPPLFLGEAILDAITLPNAALSTSGWAALAFSVEAFVLLVFYGSAVDTQRWLAVYDEGMQVDVGHSFPWDRVRVRSVAGAWDIHVEGIRFGPLAGFRPSAERSGRLADFLELEEVPVLDGPAPGEIALKASVAGATLLLFAVGLFAWWSGLSSLLVTPFVFGAGVWGAWKVERLRGVPAPAEGRSTVTIEFDEESAQKQEGDHQRE